MEQPGGSSASRSRLSSALKRAQLALDASQASMAPSQGSTPTSASSSSGAAAGLRGPIGGGGAQPPPPQPPSPRSRGPPDTSAIAEVEATAARLRELSAAAERVASHLAAAPPGDSLGSASPAGVDTSQVLARARALLQARAAMRDGAEGGSGARTPNGRPAPAPGAVLLPARAETLGPRSSEAEQTRRPTPAPPTPPPPTSVAPPQQAGGVATPVAQQQQPQPSRPSPSPSPLPADEAWATPDVSRSATPEAVPAAPGTVLALPPPAAADEPVAHMGNALVVSPPKALATSATAAAPRATRAVSGAGHPALPPPAQPSSADGALVATEQPREKHRLRRVRDVPAVRPPEVSGLTSSAERKEWRAAEKRFQQVEREFAEAKAAQLAASGPRAAGGGHTIRTGPVETVSRPTQAGPPSVALHITTMDGPAPVTHIPLPVASLARRVGDQAAQGAGDGAEDLGMVGSSNTAPLAVPPAPDVLMRRVPVTWTATSAPPRRGAAPALPTVPDTLAALLQPEAGAAGAKALFVSNTLLMETLVHGAGRAPPRVTVLDVTSCRGVSPKCLLAVAAAHPELERLWASGSQKWKPEEVHALVQGCPGLVEVEVDLRCTAVTPLLLQMVTDNDIIRVRALTCRGLIRDPGIAVNLANALQGNNTLTTIELKGRIHADGLPYVLHAVADHPRLATVTLESVGLGPWEASFFAGKLAAAPPHVMSLNLRGNRMGDEGVAALADVWLMRDARLVALDVSRTAMACAALVALTNALAHAGSVLRTLCLAGNSLGSSDGQQALGTLLLRSTCLDTLDCSFCSFMPDNMAAVLRALGSDGCNLRQLQLRGNRLGNDGAMGMAAVLRSNTSLRHIDMGDCGITSDGAVELATAARGNTSLKSLALEYNNVGETGLRSLEAARSATLALFL